MEGNQCAKVADFLNNVLAIYLLLTLFRTFSRKKFFNYISLNEKTNWTMQSYNKIITEMVMISL